MVVGRRCLSGCLLVLSSFRLEGVELGLGLVYYLCIAFACYCGLEWLYELCRG